MGRFDGKVALVTGGANGIGAATSEKFAAEGASVVVVDLEQGAADAVAQKVSGAGGKAIGVAADVTNHSTAKGGLQSMARTLAIELGRFNINVNAVAPGFVETRMTQETARRMGVDFEDFKKGAAEMIPLKRVGQPADIANVIAFLCH